MELEVNDVGKTYRGGNQAAANVSMRIGPGVLGPLGSIGTAQSKVCDDRQSSSVVQVSSVYGNATPHSGRWP